MTATRFRSFSIVFAQFWTVNDACLNYASQDVTETPVAGTTSDSISYVGSVGEINIPEVSYKDFTFGQNTFIGRAVAGIDVIPSFTATLSEVDFNLNRIANNSPINTTTVTNTTISSQNFTNQIPATLGMSFTTAIQDAGSGCDGIIRYRTFVFPKTQCVINYSPATTDAGNDTQSAVVTIFPTRTGNHAWGTAFTSSEGFAGNKTFWYEMVADAPYACTTHFADTGDTSYTVGYLPRTTDVASGNTTNVFTVDGVVTAPTSFNTTTGAVTIPAATAGEVYTAFYQVAVPDITPV